MTRISLLIAAAAVVGFAGAPVSTPAAAQGAGTQIKDGLIGFYDHPSDDCPYPTSEGFGSLNDCIADRTASQNGETTLGDAISAGYMGNTANPRPSGNGVLPSLSPGSTSFGPFISDAVQPD